MSHHASGPEFGFPRGDARLDMTDLYAFPKPGDPGKSILVLNVHPSVGVNPPGPTTKEPFAPGALYEFKIDTDADAVADIAYSVQFSSSEDGKQTATLRRTQGERAAGVCDDGEVIVEAAPVSVGREAVATTAGDCRLFCGRRSAPFFFDANGFFNKMQFTGDDFFSDKNVCSIVLEVPNSALGTNVVGLWARTLDNTREVWIQAGVECRCKRFSFPENRGRHTSTGTRRMMIASLPATSMPHPRIGPRGPLQRAPAAPFTFLGRVRPM